MKQRMFISLFILITFLTSCAPRTVTPAPTTLPTATTEPTITPTPIPTINVDGLAVQDPHFSNPELLDLEKISAPIPQLVAALQKAGIDVDAITISENLIYKVVKAKNGDSNVILLTTDIATTKYDEGGIPLLIYSQDSKPNSFQWKRIYLKDAARLHNILLGTVVDGFERLNDINPQLFDDNFNMVTMPISYVDLSADDMDKQIDYRLSEISGKKLEQIMWFHLGDIPIQNQTFQTREEAVTYTNNVIDQIIEKYGENITIADIFNEVNNTNDNPVHQIWKRFGDQFIIDVYQHIREKLPGRIIIINNSFNYSKTIEGSTYSYTLEYANLLKSNGLIDAVGMEMHQGQSSWGVEHPLIIDDAVEVMRSFGLPVYVTELDVNQTYLPGTDIEKRIQQANLYEDVIRACVRSGVCEMVNFWVSTDQSSWYEFAVGEPNANAGIFENDGSPKLAYYTVLRGFLDGY